MSENTACKIDKKAIAEKNPKIDRSLVDKFEVLENQLKKLGVDVKPKFNIEPPLGGKKLYLYNT